MSACQAPEGTPAAGANTGDRERAPGGGDQAPTLDMRSGEDAGPEPEPADTPRDLEAARDAGRRSDAGEDMGAGEPEDMRRLADGGAEEMGLGADEEMGAPDLDPGLDQGGADMAPAAPPAPAGLQQWRVGDEADARVTPQGPGLILMGGGPDVDEAFVWWRPRIAGGDVVVLRASGADGYNDYLYTTIGGADSVHTMVVDSRALAEDPYVTWQLDRAEGIFIAGGDQAVYLSQWEGTALHGALERALGRGAIVGGTSAGCAILGRFVFSAAQGTVYSDEALSDPYGMYVTLQRDVLAAPGLEDVITDTHFYERDRLGRLVAFVARLRQDGWSDQPLGLGVDEATALVIDAAGQAQVLGSGYVYAVDGSHVPQVCQPGQPLRYTQVPYGRLAPGQTFTLPGRQGLDLDRTLEADAGALSSGSGHDLY